MANRLQHETSPYLLQHAHNPVDWYPWGDEALERARNENKLILISIGYSACHWCHVMERESFEDDATAAVMNSHFINIKVDREERPDLDHVYMDAVQAISGSGGWPLNVFLTPDAKPFYGGTYFPPVRAYNRSSWREVLHAITSAWKEKPEEILSQSENLTQHLGNASLFGVTDAGNVAFTEEQLNALSANLLKAADTEWGGFGKAPKFPQTMCIRFLLHQYYFLKKGGNLSNLPFGLEQLLQQATLSLDKMMNGGLYDQLGGGFARYSTDAKWLAPHFEKMLYDNALLLIVYAEAYQLTKKQDYARLINQTMQFVKQEWQDADGGFFSAYDADSEGVEGKFYTWSKAEIEALLNNSELSQLFCEFYDVTEHGNWEETNILWITEPLDTFCAKRKLNPEATAKQLEEAAEILLKQRSKRMKPLLDDKKLLGWNGLMITACVKAWAALGNSDYLEMAERAAAYVEQKMKTPEGAYKHNEKNGRAANPAFLDDLAFYIEANIHLQEATGNLQYLETARSLTTLVLKHFSDETSPYFYFTPDFQQDIIVRKKDNYDGATPSGNSVMARNLLYLGTLYNDKKWLDQAGKMLGRVEKSIIRYPTSFANWAQLLQWQVYGVNEIAVLGNEASDKSEQILGHLIPNKVLQWAALPNEDYPLLAGKGALANTTEIYLCKQFSCQKPVQEVTDLLEMI